MNMKSFFKLLVLSMFIVAALFTFVACGTAGGDENSDGVENGANSSTDGNGEDGNRKEDDNNEKEDNGEVSGGEKEDNNEADEPPLSVASDILIVYFSCTNTTEAIAKHIEAETDGTLYEIVPEIPYTADDLKYYTNCRADKEQADGNARPAINGSVENMHKYGVVFLGYPIWHGQAPRIISTFLESYDFAGKTIVPFCTSASSGIGNSDTNLHSLAPSAEWLSGKRFPSGASRQTVSDWLDSLDLKSASAEPLPENPPEEQKKEITAMYITVNGKELEVTLAKNRSAEALAEKLKEGDITYTADDYGGFEKVGGLGFSLPTENTQITARAGDVILYQGNRIVLFYGSNTWSYTRLGKINGYSDSELCSLLGGGKGSVQVTISLNGGVQK